MHARRYVISVMAVLVGLSAGLSYAKGKLDTVTYEVKMSGPYGDMGTRKMYKKGDYFVWEADSAGLKLRFIKNKDGCFTLHPTGRFAAKYPKGSNRESPMTFLPGPAGDVRAFLDNEKAKKEGDEAVGKTTCEIYTYTEKDTKWQCKLWVEKTKLAPVKLVMTGAKKTDVINVTYLSYKTGVVIADSRFELPKDIEIRQMPDPDKTKNAEKADGEAKKDATNSKPAEKTDSK